MSWDAIIVGSGAAGLTAAVTAARKGLKVLVLEKTDYFGGTTAVSGGGIWIPGNMHARAAGIDDPKPVARQYILDAVGEGVRADLVDAYLDNGPAMVEFLAKTTDVAFVPAPPSWDWYPAVPGARDTGRLLAVAEYDGKLLGKDGFDDVQPPRTEFNAPGGFMIDLFDLPHLAGIGKSFQSTLYMGKLALRFATDKLLRRYPRGTRLTMGNALVARLLHSALAAGVTLRKGASVAALVTENGRVTGVKLVGGEQLLAKRGVVMATGGWSMNPQLRKAYMPHADSHVSIMQAGSTGDGMNMGLESGGVVDGTNHANGVWAVVSTLTREDGTLARYAHLIDMAKPGCIAVNAAGKRFGNEASVMFVDDMHKSNSVPAWLVTDAKFVKSYGLGMVFPGAPNLKAMLAAGYIKTGATLADLAATIGVDANGLAASVDQVNRDAPSGVDSAFGKGALGIDREMGDPTHKPNACFGPVGAGPYYAVKIFPGDGSSTVGLRIDAHTRVLDAQDAPIAGLYAAGLDANSIWRGRSPAHGCNVGPAMVLGYIAGCDLAA